MKLSQGKHVHIFDFDETLCKTNAYVCIVDKESSTQTYMHPTDYPEWRAEKWIERYPDRFEMDFSDFQGYPTKGSPISGTLTLLKVLLTSEEDVCVLVTGRDELSGPRAWLLNHAVDVDRMILMCSGNPNKRMCYESVINTLQPRRITIYEDASIYVNQCEEVCQKYEIKFDYKLIKP